MTDRELEKVVRFLKGESDTEERAQIEAWLQEPSNKQEFDHLTRIWTASGELYKNYTPDLSKAWRNIESGISVQQKKTSETIALWKWAGRAAAALVAAMGVALIVMRLGTWSEEPLSAKLLKISTTSAIDSVLLSDGSMIWLNRNTTIQFPEHFDEKERRIILSGEAFFKVEKDTERPFIVEAQGTITRVLGTSFNIDARETNPSVAVFTGKVSFSEDKNPENSAILMKGEKAQINLAGHTISKSEVDPNQLAWKTGILVFQNTPLSEVAKVLSEHYHISVASEIPDTLSLTTSFEKQSLEEVLEVICMTLDLKYDKTSEGYILEK